MNLSATRIGNIFGLNGQEMNAVLCKLDILEGKPGEYALTETGKRFGRYNYYDNGYGGYAARAWDTISYDESIIDWLHENMNKEIVREAIAQLKAHRIAQKEARVAEQAAYEAELLRKKQEEAAAMAEALRRQRNFKKGVVITGGVVTAALIAGITWFCIHRSQKKKKEAERAQLKKDRATEIAMNAYYYNGDSEESGAQSNNL